MGRYAAKLQRLFGMPEDPAAGGSVPFGSFRPADIPAAVMELVPQRLRELDLLSRDEVLSPQSQGFFAGHKFHTYEDFCLQKKHGQPGKKDYIGYGDSLQRGIPISPLISGISASGTGISESFWRRRSRPVLLGRCSTLPSISPGKRNPARATSRKRSLSCWPGKKTPGCGS